MVEIYNYLLTSFPSPINFLLIAVIFVIAFSLFFPLFGKLINWIETLQMIYLSKILSRGLALMVINRLTFIGTVIHEYAHAILAVVTGAQVTKINVIDLFRGNQLGHVEFYTRGNRLKQSFQLFFASCAPVVFGIILVIIGFVRILPKCTLWWHYVLFWYVIISIINHCSMSDADLRLYRKGAVLAVPVLILGIFVLQYILQPV